MGKRASAEVAEPNNQATPATGAPDVQPAGVPSQDANAGADGRKARGNGQQQQRTRRAATRGSGDSNATGRGVGELERADAAKPSEKAEALSQSSMGPVDVGRVQKRSDARLPDAELLLKSIEAAPVMTRSSLLRFCAQTAQPGIACEFGVYEGWSLRQIRNFRKPPVFGFDSWQGLPKEWKHGKDAHPQGHFACEVPGDFAMGVHLVQGWFSETIPAWLAEHEDDIQLLHIDCDLYESAKEVLTGLNDRIKPGCIVLFDELCSFDGSYPNWQEGEWKALLEWGRKVKPIARTDHNQVAFVVED